MAYIVSTTQTATANAATYTVTLGAHVSGDLLLVCLTNDGGGTAIAPDATSATAGWAMIGTQAASGGIRHAWAYLIADSASEVNPVFTGATDDWLGTCIVVRDAHATAPFGATPTSGTDFVRTDWNAVNSSASGALTSAVGECLLLYSWGSDATSYMRCKLSEAVEVDKYATANISHIIGRRQQQSAGAAPTVTMYNHVAVEGGNGWVLAIRNKTGGALQPDLRTTATEPKWYGSWAAQHDGVTWQAPDQFAATINSIVCSSTAPTIDNTNFWLADGSTYGAHTRLTSSENISLIESPSGSGGWVGGTHTITSTDTTGKIFSIELASVVAANGASTGAEGLLVCFSDGTNWAAYQPMSATKGWAAGDPDRVFVAPGQGTAYASSGGAVTWSAITRIGYFFHRKGTGTGTTTFSIKNALLLDSATLTGGGSSRPATFLDLQTFLNSWGLYRVALLQASSQVMIRQTTQIGDGTNETYFDGSAQSFEFPQAWSASRVSNWQMNWNVADSQVALKVKTSASDTIKLAAGVAATDTLQALTIDSASSGAATYDFGQSFVGWTPTWDADVACANATFSACDPVATKGADFTSVIVKNTLAGATEAAVTVDTAASTLDTCTIDVTGTSAGYHLELGTSCTSITLTDVTFTGTPATDKVHVLATTGTVTININGTTSLSAGDVTSAGATVSIVSTPLYQSVTINGVAAGYRVQIYDTTSSTELSNAIAAGTSVTWTDGSVAAADRAIRVRIAYVSGATAKQFIEATIGTCGQTSGTEAVTYLANVVNDTVYNNNAIDGDTVTGVTFTDAATDVININVAAATISWKSIYAAWVAYAFTATGIATDIDYIDAIDEANYLLSNLVVKNTSSPSVPLEITGGYARDATTLAAIDLIDTTGGTIVVAPDHVVSYATDSGVTAGDITNIASAVITAAATTPIHSDIRKVNSYAVDGTGQTGNEWGPV